MIQRDVDVCSELGYVKETLIRRREDFQGCECQEADIRVWLVNVFESYNYLVNW